jgi:hypothetical protein
MTPEGKVKRKVSKLLLATDQCYYFMPVQSGYGTSTLDYLGSHCGHAFAIETKAPGKKPTKRQEIIIREMEKAGIVVFIIDGETLGLQPLKDWLIC